MKKKILFFFSVIVFCGNVFSQGHTEDFNDGDLTGWSGQADYVLTNTGTELEIDANKVSRWNSFQYDFAYIDISANPYVSLKVKTDIDFNLNFSIWDTSTTATYAYPANHGYLEIVHSDNFAEYTFDFTGVAVDLTAVTRLNFVFNAGGGAEKCNVTAVFDDIQIGNVALVMPEMTKIQDQYHVMNAPAVTVPFWGVMQRASGAISITATSSDPGLIPNPTVTYSSPDAEGTLTYTPVTNQAGIATITVTTSEVGVPDNKVFSFDVNVETNMAPTIDQAADANIVAGIQNDLVLTGLADGNPNDNQGLTITATSSNTGILPNPTISYTAGDFECILEATPGAGQTGTVTITVSVQDDGGTLNGGVDTQVMTFDVTVYEAVNNPPEMNQPSDISILENLPEQTVELRGITDGDVSSVQGITITATSSNTGLVPDPTVIYSSGLNSGQLLYTSVADQTGTATITVTLTDDGGLPINNGDESTIYTFDIEVRVAPIIGWADDFEDGVLTSQWPGYLGPSDWGTENSHHCVETGGALDIEIDKTRTNNKWAGLWFNIPNELDLSDNPYISIRMRTTPGNIGTAPNDMLIFLWDAYDVYNTAKTIKYTVTNSYVEYYFDYSDPSYQLRGDGTPVDISRIKALLFNFDPGGATLLQGHFLFDDLRIGNQANTLPITPQVSMDTLADYAVIQDAGAQVITLTNLTDGADNSAGVSIAVSSSNTTLIPTPVASAVSNKQATLTYTPGVGQTGTSTITVTASAAGSISNVQSFTIDVIDLIPANADDITIDLTTEYQEIDGFGAFMGSGGVATDSIITLAEDIGMSMARIGIIGGGFEEVNDNSDPYIINLDAYNPSALSLSNIRRIAPFVDKFILTVWSPAGWMKTCKSEGSIYSYATDNHLEPRFYEEYAEEIIAAIKVIKRETGVELYAIGLQNEPEFNEPYPSCQVGYNEFRDIIKVVGKRLDDEGLGNIQLYFAEALPPQGHLQNYMDAVKNDPIAEGYADIAALHNYDVDGASVGSVGCSAWADFYTWANTGGTGSQYKTWMTETSGHANNWDGAMTLAGNIFNALDCGNASAWVFWSFSVGIGSPQYGLVVSNTPSARYYISKQYYKFIRPGAIRVDVTSAGIPALAFKDNAAGTVTVILFNNTAAATAIEIGGVGLPTSWQSYTTSDRRNCERGLDVGADGMIILPPSSLTTLVGYYNPDPTVDPVSNISIMEDDGLQTVNLTGITDGEAGFSQTVTITAVSDNQSLIPNPTVNYTSGNASGNLTFTPVAEKYGSATITVTLTDDGSPVGSIVETFIVSVTDINDQPNIDPISNNNCNEDAGLQTVNLTGIDDGDIGGQTISIALSGYNAGLIGTPSVNYTSGNATGSITFTPVANVSGTTTVTVTVTDNGGTANGGVDTKVETFDVTVSAVNDEPVINVIANQNATTGQLSSVNLTGIGDGDADATQSITVTASSSNTGIVPDPTVTYTSDNTTGSISFTPGSAGTSTITITVQDNGGTANGGDDTRVITFDVNVTDPVNLNPTIDAISDVNILEDDAGEVVNLTGIGDGNGWLQTVTITATSSNTGIVPDPTVTYTSGNATGTLSFAPVADASGSVTITVTATDDGSPVLSTITTFTVNITAVNDEPVIDAISNPSAILENAALQTINMTGIGDGDAGTQAITITATSSNTTLIPSVTVNYTSGATGSLTYTPATNESGSSTITVTVQDNGGTANSGDDTKVITFDVSVTDVNNTPTLDVISDPAAILEDAGQQTISLSGIGDGGDGAQTISVTANETTSLLSAITVNYTSANATGNIQYTPLPGANGTATIEVTVQDDGGTANGAVDNVVRSFDVVITPVNDEPVIDAVSNLNILEDAGAQTVNLTGIADSDGGTQTLSAVVSGGNPALISTPLLTYSGGATGTINFTPVANANGSTTITVTVSDDGGTANGGDDTRVITFDVNITAVNDEPVINVISNQTILPAVGRTINLTGIGDGDADATQSLTVAASSSNTSIVATPNITYTSDNATGTLDFTSVALGTATITVTVTDNGGTANSGDDTRVITFDVNVSAVGNNNPTIDAITDELILEDAGLQTVNLTGISDGDGWIQVVSIAATSNNTSLIPDPSITYSSGDATGTLSYTPVAGASGSATITVTVSDDLGAQEIIQFAIDVTAVNDQPNINAIAKPTAILENAAMQTINLSGINDGDAGSQGISITASSDNTTLIPTVNVNYTSGTTGTLTYTPAAWESGTATITVTVTDDGGTANGGNDTRVITFDVDVTDINNTPGIDVIANPAAILEDAGQQTISLTGISDGGDGGQTITVSANETTSLLSAITVNYTSADATGNIQYTPLAGAKGTATIEVTVLDDGGTANGAVNQVVRSFDVVITPVNDEPLIDAVSDVNILEDAGLQTVNLTGISDNDGGTQTVSVVVTGGNPALISTPLLTYGGGSTGSIDFTPVADANGSTTITVTVSDDGGTANSGVDTRVITFDVIITAVNDQPAIGVISNQAASVGSLKTVNLAGITDGDGWSQVVSITASSDNTASVPDPTVNYTSGDGTGTLTFTPLAVGTATITLTVQDDAGTANGGVDTRVITFDVTVSVAPNNNPTIDLISDATINEDAGLQTVNMTGISDGDGWVQTVTVAAVSNNTALIPDPSIVYTTGNATATLSYTPVAGAFGLAQITVTVADNLGAEQIIQFNVTVNSSNDEPVIDPISDPADIMEGSGIQTINLTGISDGDDGSQTITITANSDNTALIPTVDANYSGGSTGTLTYTPVAGQSGTATITVQLTDNGSTANGGDSVSVYTFTVTVIDINVSPTLDAIVTPIAVLEDNTGTVTVNLSNITDGGDGGQTLTVTAEEVTATGSLLTNLYVDYTSPDNTATLTYDILPEANGDAVIFVTVKDDGGTVNNAVDTIYRQFIQTITSVNDQPVCDAISDVDMDAGIVSAVILTGLADGDPEVDQSLTVTAEADDTTIVTNVLYSEASNAITITSAGGVSGTTTITVTISDNSGTDNGGEEELVLTFDVNVNTVSVSENSVNTIMLYPNPATNFINVKMYDNTFNTMIVSDISGRRIETVDLTNISKEYRLDVSNYSRGSYMLTLINDSGEYFGRFIVK